MRLRIAAIGAWAALNAAPATADDLFMLQQAVLPDETASIFMVLDRDRVALALLRQLGKRGYVVEVTLVGEPNIVVTVNCGDVASGRQVLEALRGRGRGAATLDISGRCSF